MIRIIAVALAAALLLGGCTVHSPLLRSDPQAQPVVQMQPQPMQPIIINMPGQQGALQPQLVQLPGVPGVLQPTPQPVVQSIDQSTGKPTAEPVAQPVEQPGVQPLVQTMAQPVAQPVVQAAAQPVVEPLTNEQLTDQHKMRVLMGVAKELRETDFEDRTVTMLAKASEIDHEIGRVHAKYEDADKPTAFLYEANQPNAFSEAVLTEENIDYLQSGDMQ